MEHGDVSHFNSFHCTAAMAAIWRRQHHIIFVDDDDAGGCQVNSGLPALQALP